MTAREVERWMFRVAAIAFVIAVACLVVDRCCPELGLLEVSVEEGERR